MGRPPSPAQRAVQITFVLKGHLENVQVAYIRVAALLAKVRDEKLYRALGHATMDDYAAARLGLPRPAARATLPLPRGVRLDPRVPPAVARAPPEGFHPRADRRAGAHVDRAPAGGPAPERRPAEGVGAAACEGARGAAHAARVPGGAPPGVRRHAAAARGPADAARRTPALGRHSGAVGEVPCDARRADRGDRGGGRNDPRHRAACRAAAAPRGAGVDSEHAIVALESKGLDTGGGFAYYSLHV